MAEIARAGTPAVLLALPLAANRIGGLRAGEDIAAGDACYIRSNRKVYRSSGAVAGEAADVRGFAVAGARRGEVATLVFDVTMRYGQGLPPSDGLYLSETVPGGLADSPSPGGTEPVAFVVDATRIHVLQSEDEPTAGRARGRAGG
jgi:hypothetical protein